MKRTISVVLIVMMLLLTMPNMIIGADDGKLDELWAEKIAYENNRDIATGSSENMWDFFYEVYDWNFVLYTKAGQNLTYEVRDASDSDYLNPYELLQLKTADRGETSVIYDCLYSPELSEIYWASYPKEGNGIPGISKIRNLVKTLDISKEEFYSAYEKMKNEPDAVRNLVSCLTDEDFNLYLEKVKKNSLPTKFIAEAIFLKDDAQSHYLLSKTGTIYIPELGYALVTKILMTDCINYHKYADWQVEYIAKNCDLTTKGFEYYLKNLRKLLTVQSTNFLSYYDFPEGQTPLEQLEYLEAAREAQLKAAQTGDGAVTTLWVVAVAIPTLAVLVLARKKRRI